MPRRKEPVGTLSLFDRDEPTRDASATLPEAPAAASLRGSLLAQDLLRYHGSEQALEIRRRFGATM